MPTARTQRVLGARTADAIGTGTVISVHGKTGIGQNVVHRGSVNIMIGIAPQTATVTTTVTEGTDGGIAGTLIYTVIIKTGTKENTRGARDQNLLLDEKTDEIIVSLLGVTRENAR